MQQKVFSCHITDQTKPSSLTGVELVSTGPAEGWPLNIRGSVSFGRVLPQEKSPGSTLAGSFHHIQIHSACWEKNHPSESWTDPTMSEEEAHSSQTPAVPDMRKPKALGSQQVTAVKKPTKLHRISPTSQRTPLQGC